MASIALKLNTEIIQSPRLLIVGFTETPPQSCFPVDHLHTQPAGCSSPFGESRNVRSTSIKMVFSRGDVLDSTPQPSSTKNPGAFCPGKTGAQNGCFLPSSCLLSGDLTHIIRMRDLVNSCKYTYILLKITVISSPKRES